MTRFLLRTLGGIRLDGPDGRIAIPDRLGLALLVLVALSPDGAVEESEALLRLTPSSTPDAGRAQLAETMAAIERATGIALVRRDARRLTVDPVLELDVEPAPAGDRGAPTMMTGFALPHSPEFTEWLTAARTRYRPREGFANQARASALPPLASIAVGLGGLLLLGAVYATRTTEPEGFHRGDPIVLAELDNATGDTLFDRSLISATTVALGQSPQLSILPDARVTAALRRIGTPTPTPKISLALAREVAVRENARFALGLRIESAGAGYRISADLADAESGRIVGHAEAGAETKAGTINALDRVLQDIRGTLGEHQTERRSRSIPLPEATTPSLEALRAYAQGAAAWSGGEFRIAKELWERAIDLDTGFALAMGALGAFSYHHHDRETGRAWYERALARQGRLTEWERLRLTANFASYRGDRDSALAVQRTLIDRYPSGTAWYNYGVDLMASSRHQDAIPAFEKALTFDSVFVNAYINLATSARVLGREDDALRFYGRAERLDSAVLMRGNVAAEYGNLLIRTGRPRDGERHFRRMLERVDLFDRSIGARGLAYLAVREGRLDEAVGFFRGAVDAATQQAERGHLSLFRARIGEAMTLLLIGDAAAGNRALDAGLAALSATTPPGFRALASAPLGRTHRSADLDLLAAAIDRSRDPESATDSSALRLVDAERHLLRGRVDSALVSYRRVSGAGLSLLARMRSMEALAEGDPRTVSSARLDSLLAAEPIGLESQLEWPWAVVRAGDILAAAGNPTGAIARYRTLVDRWAGGDSTSTLLKYARRRIVELGAAR